MTDEKIEAMLTLIHQENKVIMEHLLAMRCYPKDLEKTLKQTEKQWDEALDAVLRKK